MSDYVTSKIVHRSNLNYTGAAVYCAPEFTDTGNPDAAISRKVSISVRLVLVHTTS